MMPRALIFLLLCLPPLCRAETPTWGVAQLMQGLAQTKTAQATFTERKFLSVLSRPLESSGTLLFQAPGHLEKHTLKPKVESLVLDQGVLTIDSKARNIKRTLVLQEYPSVWAFVESIRSTLAGDLPTLERFYQTELKAMPRAGSCACRLSNPGRAKCCAKYASAGAATGWTVSRRWNPTATTR